ncbi:MAG: PhzF family phenazine biosynthesis protein [Gemmatimonadales bacterium]|nr:PhzF family phenazine biosynthesis protein [Gemmatimonadales bacterium]
MLPGPLALSLTDAFITDAPFSGNPAGVVVTESALDEALMRGIARELNQAETAFLVRLPDGDWSLRWLTPTVEVDLCGHATLASAHRLRELGLEADTATTRFHTRSGLLTATGDGTGLLWLDFPATPAAMVHDAAARAALAAACGVEPVAVGRSPFDYVVEVRTADEVRALAPDMGALARIEARGVIVTAPGDAPGVGFVSRFFGPQSGVPEDPVTGSAHCALLPWWAARVGTRTEARQLSPRGGRLAVELHGDRVRLGGRAMTRLVGTLQP